MENGLVRLLRQRIWDFLTTAKTKERKRKEGRREERKKERKKGRKNIEA